MRAVTTWCPANWPGYNGRMSHQEAVTAFDGYRAVARDLEVALEILVKNPSPPALACGILAGQAAER
jgi:hypothetical protein